MNELEDRVDELECVIEEKDAKISDLESRYENFAKTCAIMVEQMWDKVYPGVSGVDLRDLV